jgi:hypothetical protein
MTKILLPPEPNFSSTRALELAHLIELAYQHYDCQQAGTPWQPKQTKQLIGSTAYVQTAQELDQNNIPPNLPGWVQYELLDFLHFTGFWWTKPETVPFGFIAKRPPDPQAGGQEEIFVVFRGTREVAEWYRNFDFTQEAFLGDINRGLVSKGFQIIYTRAIQNENLKRFVINHRTGGQGGFLDDRELSSVLLDIIQQIQGNDRAIAQVVEQQLAQFQPGQCKVFVTGHSLGGALATLAACHIKMLGFDVDLYTFASPRVGDPTFAANFQGLNCYRIANSEDVVTVVPPATDRVIGDEMLLSDDKGLTMGRRKTVFFLEKLLDLLPTKIFEQTYQHIGTPLYFTNQQKAASTNHNMFLTYREAIHQP